MSQAPPPLSTPSRPRKSHTRVESNPTALRANSSAPPNGYSYLTRSTCISTPSRSRPQGFTHDASRSPALSSRPSLGNLNLQTSPKKSHEGLQRRKTIHQLPALPSMGFTGLPRSTSEATRLADAVSKLPKNPKGWTPSQVALYLTHVLGLVPRPIVEDVTAYVRTSRMGGRAFLRLSEKDLENQGLNLKWRRLMIEAVRKLRRDALRGRIWGYEGGNVSWPRTTDEDPVTPEEEGGPKEEDGIVRGFKGVSKLTLKRMRDSRKVKGMIMAFQNSPSVEERAGLSEQELAALGMDQIRKGHVSNRSGSGDLASFGSPRAPLLPVYGAGYVKGQADSFDAPSDSEHDVHRPTRSRKSSSDFPFLAEKTGARTDSFDALLASLSEQEANELATELGLGDLKDMDRYDNDEVAMVPHLNHNESDGGMSNCSSMTSFTDSEAEEEQDISRYGLLDMDLINSIMSNESETNLRRSQTTGSLARPERPYRASLYTEEDIAFVHQAASHSRTESSIEVSEGLGLKETHFDVSSPNFNTAKRRDEVDSAAPKPAVTELFAAEEYTFEPPRSQFGSVRKSMPGTYGSKRGKQMLSMLSSGEPNGSVRTRKPRAAEDEEGWGGTVGRLSTRKSLNQIYMGENEVAEKPLDRYEETKAEKEDEKRRVEKRSSALFSGIKMAPIEQAAEGAVAPIVVHNIAEPTAVEPVEAVREVDAEPVATVHDKVTALPAPAPQEEEGLSQDEPIAAPETELETTETEIVVPAAAVELVTQVPGKDAPATTHQKDLSAIQEEPAAVLQEKEAVTHEELAVPQEFATMEEDTSESADSDEPVAQEDDVVPEEVNVGSTSQEQDVTPEENTAQEASFEPVVEDQPKIIIESEGVVAEPASQVEASTPGQQEITETEDFTIVDPPLPSHLAFIFSGTAPVEDTSKLLVPLTTLEPDATGTGSSRKRSMVLVDRQRFESLARRMALLETQLDDLETSSQIDELLTPSSRSWTSYLQTFNPFRGKEDKALSLGAIPAYMLGLGAGVSFVLVREVLGRKR